MQMNSSVARLAIAVVSATTLALAQDSRNVVHVPLSDPKQPARVRVSLLNGSITVRAADIQDVIVEGGHVRNRDHEEDDRDREAESRGMKRIYPGGPSGFEVREEHNLIVVKTSIFEQSSGVTVTAPRRTSLQLKSINNGGITVEGVEGEIDVDDLNGPITLRNVSGSILAHSLNGAIKATLSRPDPSQPMSFSTLNGTIDVTVPDNIKASLRMKTDNGEIFSDFDVKMTSESAPEKDSGRQRDGSYRVRFDRVLHGNINGGGPEYQFTTFNGRIYIRRRK